MAKGYTEEQIKEIVEKEGYEYCGFEIKIVGNKKRKKKYIKIKCQQGHEYEIEFSNFQQGQRCAKCKGLKKLSFEEVKEYIENFEYKVLSTEYKNTDSKLLIQCEKGHIYETTYHNFKGTKNRKGRRCPHCANNIKYIYDFVKEHVEKFNYKLISEKYENAHEKLIIQCDNSHIFKMSFDHFKRGCRCPHCNGNAKHTIEYIKSYIENENYQLISTEYINNEKKLSLICDKGHECEISFGNFTQGKRCGICNNSKGETEIFKILLKYNIDFVEQYKFNDCKYNRELRFDFYLPDYNCCIEFDGQQHFQPVECFGGEKEFEKIKIRDTIKNNYCKDNNIELIRIPYFEFDNIKEILKRELGL